MNFIHYRFIVIWKILQKNNQYQQYTHGNQQVVAPFPTQHFSNGAYKSHCKSNEKNPQTDFLLIEIKRNKADDKTGNKKGKRPQPGFLQLAAKKFYFIVVLLQVNAQNSGYRIAN